MVILALVAAMLLLATPVLAASLGISPSQVKVSVPSNGSTEANFKVHYFSGDLEVSLVDIPLEVEPERVHVEASDEPQDITLTIYGDESLGPQVYNGYIRFLGLSGETVAVAVKVKAQVTNIAGELAEEPGAPAEESPPPAQSPPAQPPSEQPPMPPKPPAPDGGFPVIPVVGIGGGVAVLITIIVLVARRNR